MIKIGIIGGTGYTGVELLRLLSLHPKAEILAITSRSNAGIYVSDYFPNLILDLKFTDVSVSNLSNCDVVFCATPNGIAMTIAEQLLNNGVKLIDLAADFRFSDVELWSQWYGMQHASPSLLSLAVYGLPEANQTKIKLAKLVGNPGCYPTAVSLGLLPFLKNKLINGKSIIADCKSGVSGAGRGVSVANLQAESAENFKAYAIDGHRHQPEIEHNLSKLTNQTVKLTFMPHLIPMIRGIYATIYCELADAAINAKQVLAEFYQDDFFVTVVNGAPETRWVKGSNHCKIAVQQNGKQIIIFSVIDNLVKGASGQAIQNMNLMFDLPPSLGLEQVALMP